MAHRLGNQVHGIFPGINTHFGLWREFDRLHGHGVRMRRDIIRQDQNRGLTVAHKITCHGEDKVGVSAIHLIEKGARHLHCDVGLTLAESWGPARYVVIVKEVRHGRTKATGLSQHGGHHPIRRPFQQVPDEGATNAEAEDHELRNTQMIHQANVIIGVGVPGAIDLQRTGRLTGVGIAQVSRDAAVLALKLLHGVEGMCR